MTPQERQLVENLFDRLAKLESAPRDAEAERAIVDGLRHAPNAVYPLVQTVLVQDEALKRADARIRELTGEDDDVPSSGGFLDSMRQALTGRSATSVPSVRPAISAAPDPRWNNGGAFTPAAPPSSAAQSGSFLGTAAASAAGVIGGALLLNSISSMFSHHGGSAFGAPLSSGSASNSPWDNSAAGSDLARDAGLNDISNGPRGDARPAGFLDIDATDSSSPDDDFSDDAGGDFGGGDSA
jgi:uncharacterized protein